MTDYDKMWFVVEVVHTDEGEKITQRGINSMLKAVIIPMVLIMNLGSMWILGQTPGTFIPTGLSFEVFGFSCFAFTISYFKSKDKIRNELKRYDLFYEEEEEE